MSKEKMEFGVGPPLEVVDKLPTPEEVFNVPKITRGNLVTKIMGPALLALGGAIGSGEWLMGPTVTAGYGLLLFWLVLTGCLLQTVFNVSFARVTLATGEPAILYYTRAKGGSRLWGSVLSIMLILHAAWPGWAATSATALFVLMFSRLAGAADAGTVRLLGVLLFLVCILVTLFGHKVERTLELFFWVSTAFQLVVLILIMAPLVVTTEALAELGRGFVNFGYVPAGIDIFLLAGWWAYIGYASGHNYDISAFYRDKEYGMSHEVGYIPALIGGKMVPVSAHGKTFKTSPENIATWRKWFKILVYDQWFIFFIGAMIGMILPSLLIRSLLPVGTKLPTWAIAAAMCESFGKKVGPWGFYLVALVGMLLVWDTQLQAMDKLVRNFTSLSWGVSDTLRRWAKGDIRRIYYGFFFFYALFAIWAMYQTQPMVLILLGANAANITGIFTVPLTMWANKQLPKEIRPKIWEYIVLVIFWIFNIFFAVALGLAQVGIKIF